MREMHSLPCRVLLVCVWVLCLENKNGGLAVLNSVLVQLRSHLQGLDSVCLINKDIKAWSGFHAQITGRSLSANGLVQRSENLLFLHVTQLSKSNITDAISTPL